MNSIGRRTFQAGILVFSLFFMFMVEPAWAEEGAREWRPTYDLAMRWINFGILVFLLGKFAAPLLFKVLKDRKSEIQQNMERIRQEKDQLLAKLQEAKFTLENSGERLEEIKNRIIDQGERRKQEIIESANEQSEMMLKSAKERIGNLINLARRKLMIDLLDMAMEKAIERLPGEITGEDDNRLIKKYLEAAAGK
jgi:F-type H+-transporting ATPase subunit b